MREVRWGLLGTARINRRLIPAMRAAGRSTVTAMASRDRARAEACAREWDVPHAVGSYAGLLARPCLAIQPTEFGEAWLDSTVVLPLTTELSPEDAFPLRVGIPKGTCGLERESEVLVDQILAWDNLLFHKELGLLPEALIEKVSAAVRDFLDI